jgi:hypothetical protein
MGNLSLFYKLYKWYTNFMAILKREVSPPPVDPRDALTIQLMLLRNGFLIDHFGLGHMNPATTQAIKAFQTKAGLKADGLVGKDTWAALNKRLKP